MKTALVCGADDFIGSHLARGPKHRGWWVRGEMTGASGTPTHATQTP